MEVASSAIHNFGQQNDLKTKTSPSSSFLKVDNDEQHKPGIKIQVL